MAIPFPSSSATCVVTGASAGIGAELARGLARRGHGVTLVARRRERLERLAAELEREWGVTADVVVADLADPGSWKAVPEAVAARGLEAEVLVNNAGFDTIGSFHKLDPGPELEEIRLNCEAVVALAGAFLPRMVQRGRGAILNVASSAGFQPTPYHAVYAATKAFVLSFSEALHAELAGTGVTVTATCPGPVRSEFASVAGSEEELRRVGPMAMSAADCASRSLEALEKGRRVVIPGLPTKLAVYASWPVPTAAKLHALKRFWGSHA